MENMTRRKRSREKNKFSKGERNLATIMHISTLFFGVASVLVLWLFKKDESNFINKHGKSAINFQLSVILYSIICFLGLTISTAFLNVFAVIIVFAGVPAYFAYLLVIVNAAVKANEGKAYHYPLTINFMK